MDQVIYINSNFLPENLFKKTSDKINNMLESSYPFRIDRGILLPVFDIPGQISALTIFSPLSNAILRSLTNISGRTIRCDHFIYSPGYFYPPCQWEDASLYSGIYLIRGNLRLDSIIFKTKELKENDIFITKGDMTPEMIHKIQEDTSATGSRFIFFRAILY